MSADEAVICWIIETKRVEQRYSMMLADELDANGEHLQNKTVTMRSQGLLPPATRAAGGSSLLTAWISARDTPI